MTVWNHSVDSIGIEVLLAFNISDFQAQVADRGFIKPNKYQATFNLPPAFRQTEADYADYISMVRDIGVWCDATSLPGIIMQPSLIRRYGYGPVEKRPIVPIFNDVQLRVICDAEMMTWELFRRWMSKTTNTDTRGGFYRQEGLGTTEQASGVMMQAFETSYPADYTTRVVISMYDDFGSEVTRVILNECYPSAISDIQLGWDNNNNLARFTVNLSLQDWNVEAIPTNA
jgi:hypothetical protein